MVGTGIVTFHQVEPDCLCTSLHGTPPHPTVHVHRPGWTADNRLTNLTLHSTRAVRRLLDATNRIWFRPQPMKLRSKGISASGRPKQATRGPRFELGDWRYRDIRHSIGGVGLGDLLPLISVRGRLR
jgi:hypothetical protein